MFEQKFGHKELYEVVIRAKTPMDFGSRHLVADEPLLYFSNVNMSLLTEQNRPVFARGGWGNLPRVIWDERSEVQFQMIEGVMSQIGMGILLGANVLERAEDQPLYVHMKEGPLKIAGMTRKEMQNGEMQEFPFVELKHKPIFYPQKKIFIFEYSRNAIQQKFYGEYEEVIDTFNLTHHRLILAEDKNCNIPVKIDREYVVDYYYKYEDEALIYTLQKERFNGLFTLEAKFYSKDENEGQNYTNLLYMPKVRIVSNINLRLGERADPTVSTFNILGLPETVGEYKNLIVDITRLGQDIDADI